MNNRGNLQQNIVLRRTPPSLNSIAEGQIVFALNPNKGLNMYTKQAGQIFTSTFHKQREDQIIDTLKVRGNATFEKDIVSQGKISGTQVYWYTHVANYTGTSKVYLAFGRATLTTGQEAYSKYIAPYNGKLIQVLARSESIAGNTIIGFHKETATGADPNSTATEAITVNMSTANTTYEFDFTVTSSFNKGDILALSMDATSAVNDIVFTSIWSMDVTI